MDLRRTVLIMKKQFSVLLLLFAFTFSVSAQVHFTEFNTINSAMDCNEVRAMTDNFFIMLQKNPQHNLFLVYYEGKYKVPVLNKGKLFKFKTVLPARGEAEIRIQAIRDHIRVRRYDSSRVWFINGGYREEFEIEPFILPKDEAPWKPTPTLDSIKFRDGKPLDFPCSYD